ncbi:unnamed protein product, partial [Gulo gulo]
AVFSQLPAQWACCRCRPVSAQVSLLLAGPDREREWGGGRGWEERGCTLPPAAPFGIRPWTPHTPPRRFGSYALSAGLSRSAHAVSGQDWWHHTSLPGSFQSSDVLLVLRVCQRGPEAQGGSPLWSLRLGE